MRTRILLVSVIFLFLFSILTSTPSPLLLAQDQAGGSSNCHFTSVSAEAQINPLTIGSDPIDPNNDPGTQAQNLGTSSVTVIGLTNDLQHWIIRYDQSPNYARLPVSSLSIDDVRKQCRFSVWGKPNTAPIVLDDYLELGQDDETHNWDLPLDVWHQTYKGDGIKIGILDSCYEGYQDFINGLSPQEREHFVDVTDPLLAPHQTSDSPDCAGLEQHGTKVAQIVYRIAPQATYYVAQLHGGENSIIPAQDTAPTQESTSEPVEDATLEPTLAADVTPGATEEPAQASTEEAVLEGTVEPIQQSTVEPPLDSTAEPGPQSTSESPSEGGANSGNEDQSASLTAHEQFKRAVDYLLEQNVDIIVHASNIFDPDAQPYYEAVYNATHNRNVLWVNAAGNIGAGYFYLESGEITRNFFDKLDTFDPDRGIGTFNRLVAPVANMGNVRLMIRFPRLGNPGDLFLELQLYDQLGQGPNVETQQYYSTKSVYRTEIYTVMPSTEARNIRTIPGDAKNLPVTSARDNFSENYLGFQAVLEVVNPDTPIEAGTKIPIEIIVLNALPARYEPTTLESLPSYVPVPADMPEVLTVGAFEPILNELAWNSSRSNNLQISLGTKFRLPDGTILPSEIKPDITAPNFIEISEGNIFSDTSTATPIVAGVAALLLQKQRVDNPGYLAKDIKDIVIDSSQCLSDSVEDKPMRRVALPATVDAPISRPECPEPAAALRYPQRQIPTGIALASPANDVSYRDTVPVNGNVNANAVGYVIELTELESNPQRYYYVATSDANEADNSEDSPIAFEPIGEQSYNPDRVCERLEARIPTSNINVNRTLQMVDRYSAGEYSLRLVTCDQNNRVVEQIGRQFRYSPQLDAQLISPENGARVVITDPDDPFNIDGIANGGEGYVLEYRRQGEQEWRVLPGFNGATAPADDQLYLIDQPGAEASPQTDHPPHEDASSDPDPDPAATDEVSAADDIPTDEPENDDSLATEEAAIEVATDEPEDLATHDSPTNDPTDEPQEIATSEALAADDLSSEEPEDLVFEDPSGDPGSENSEEPNRQRGEPVRNVCAAAQERNLLEKTDEDAIQRSLYLIDPFDRFGEKLYYDILPAGTYEIRLTLCSAAGDQPIKPALDPMVTTFTLEYQPTITFDPPNTQNIGTDDFRPLLGTAFGDGAKDYVIAFRDTNSTTDEWQVALPPTGATFAQDNLCNALRSPAPQTEEAPEPEATADANQEPALEPTPEATNPSPTEPLAVERVPLPALTSNFFTVRYDSSLGLTAQNYIGVLCADGEHPPLAVSEPVTITFLASDTAFAVDPQPRLSQYNTLHIKGSITQGSDFRYYVVRLRPETAADESPWIQVVGPQLQPEMDVCALENDPEFWPYGVMGFPLGENQGINLENSTLAMIQLDALPLAGNYEAEIRVCVDNVNAAPLIETIRLMDLPGTSFEGGTTGLLLYIPSQTLLREIPNESASGASVDSASAVSLISLSSDRSWIQVALTDNQDVVGWIRPNSLGFGAVPDNGSTTGNGQSARRYVYTSDVSGLWNIYSAQANNQNQRQLTDQGNNQYPSISPSGDEIVFTSDRDGSDGIYLMNMDGSNQRKLTEGYRPIWSPNGGLILFESEREGNVRKLFTYDISTNSVTSITTNGVGLPCCVSWSPDGSRIVYAAATSDGNYDIYIANVDGSSEPMRLTDDSSTDVNPSWQPGGNLIVFQSNRSGESQIYRINTDGTDLRQITNTPGGNLDPSWSGSAQIIFSTFRNGQLDIYIMNIDGSQQNRLFASPAPNDETSGTR